jgi:hypothetical protein
MSKSKSNGKGKSIWSSITEEQLVTAIASVNDRAKQLEKESWRMTDDRKRSTSLWGEIIQKLKVQHTEKIRHSLYNLWHPKDSRIRKLVKKESEKEGNKKQDEVNNNINDRQESVKEDDNANLLPNPSIPLSKPANTRSKAAESININTMRPAVGETSIILTAAEWKNVFSYSQKQLNDDWHAIFRNKLKSCGITCALRFGNKHIKKGKRKHTCSYFWFDTYCTNTECTRAYRTILHNEINLNASPIFRVRIYGEEHHDPTAETMRCQLRGEERYRLGMKS